MRRILCVVVPMLIIAHGSGAQTPTAVPSRFDGAWQVTVQCATAKGAAGYRWVFPATVANGRLHGEFGVRDSPDSFILDGPVQPDGAALLYGHGRTGNPGATVGSVNAGTPFAYHVKAQFDANHGTGQRVELRPCALDFVRQ